MKVYVITYAEGWEPSEIYDVCSTREIAEAVKKNGQNELPDADFSIEEVEVTEEMPRNLKDYNRHQVKVGEKFKLDGSDDIFMLADGKDEDMIVDLTDCTVFAASEFWEHGYEDFKETYGFSFFRKEDDEDFLGVDVIEE